MATRIPSLSCNNRLSPYIVNACVHGFGFLHNVLWTFLYVRRFSVQNFMYIYATLHFSRTFSAVIVSSLEFAARITKLFFRICPKSECFYDVTSFSLVSTNMPPDTLPGSLIWSIVHTMDQKLSAPLFFWPGSVYTVYLTSLPRSCRASCDGETRPHLMLSAH